MSGIALSNLKKSYGDTDILHGIDLEIKNGEFAVFVGPSGCGKSTTLRMIAGLETVTSGEIFIGDQLVNDVQPKNRGIAMVFQSYALYPHMSVYDNMAFSLKLRKMPPGEVQKRVRSAADTLELTKMLDRKPSALSGGQRQRVAMGRAIVRDPEVFLFDEPLSNLDATLRTQMRAEIKELHQRLKSTIVYVTHDQVEAMTLADRIVIMRGGKIEQSGTPEDVFHNPASMFVASFMGSPPMNLAESTVYDNGAEKGVNINGTVSIISSEDSPLSSKAGDRVVFGIRPEDIVPDFESDINNKNWTASVKVDLIELLGSTKLFHFHIGTNKFIGKAGGRSNIEPGQVISVVMDMRHARYFDPETELIIR
uniref:ABC transporter ATP-binding protein n=1 Tax=Marinobacterium profundum TaxID=1714300 RepID=UPI0008341054|nr:sn-glycerol-3-phosphate ABC transporter ATP-binding protein UgpC [Marinobacterium profundum]